MGNYNPSAPIILGQEWVGIRDEDLVFSPAVNAVETGHGFTLTTSRTLQDARFYTRNDPVFLGQVMACSVYPRGDEALTGPLRSVTIPCNSGSVTGTGVTVLTTVATALANPGDGDALSFVPSNGAADVSLFFATDDYAQQLTGKRVLAVNLLYVANGLLGRSAVGEAEVRVSIRNDAGASVDFGNITGTGVPLIPRTARSLGSLRRIRFGEVAHFWLTATPDTTSDRAPWGYPELARLEATASSRIHVHLQMFANADITGGGTLSYAALEVVYAEEKRLAVGAAAFGSPFVFGFTMKPYGQETNVLTMRAVGSLSPNPVLAAGSYTTVVQSLDIGDLLVADIPVGQGSYPTLNAMRELYAISPHPGVQVNIPFPVDDRLGQAFTVETSHILPQISMHTSGGPLPEIHVYGRQAVAPVYGAVTAVQDINDDKGAGTYPQVRFYARRWGDTTVPLTVETISPPGSTASITVDEFDALPEILDGWRQVDLRFDVAPTITPTGGDASLRWSAAGEDAGSRWEILAVSAPALSGIPGNLLNEVAPPHRLGSATYDPPAGDTVALTWLSPNVTGVVEDPATDAVVLLSQDPPTVTGFGLVELSQPVTGVGLSCGSPPRCVPTGIGYHRLSWSPVSMPASGFGGYELQRMDSVDGVWQTVMLASDITVTGFADYEARVGIQSDYRIRALNLYDFAGPWSATVSGTLSAPGVSGTRCDTGVLIFTSNSSQSGLHNLAHVMAWERGGAEEVFDFPEAAQVTLLEGFDRDFVTAFHGTERGGERFDRTLLVNAAAIDPERLADFRSLRDMAWADLPYVCVRDELGDRWLASVTVPQGRVRRNRGLYLATVRVVEVTDTPAPVDPA